MARNRYKPEEIVMNLCPSRCLDPISPTLYHWELQNTASPDTLTGRRYVQQPARGTNVILFVRERKRDGRGETLPYHCHGHARYRSHESERPMKILWKLERPMPGWLYQAGNLVAGRGC